MQHYPRAEHAGSGQMRGGLSSPSGGIPEGKVDSGINCPATENADDRWSSGTGDINPVDMPQRENMAHEVSHGGSSGQSPSQHGAASAEIPAATPADASNGMAPSRLTTITTARSMRTNITMPIPSHDGFRSAIQFGVIDTPKREDT